MAAAKEAARILGLKSDGTPRVVCFDFVKPSTQKTTWGLGGTCVNVGCVPKKLMHYAGLLGAGIDDSRHFGWSVPDEEGIPAGVGFDWMKMRETVVNHVKSLNFGYKTGLRTAGVQYINGLAKFRDDHTLAYLEKFKKEWKTLTAAQILIATGGRPHVPDDVPGALEHAITSDDIFYLKRAPGKTLCVGAGYISLECGGFLHHCGYDVDIAVRSVLLRGFDRDCADKIGEVMEAQGVKFVKGLPTSIIKRDDGKFDVTFTGGIPKATYDTVLYATGRNADTGGLDLANAGVVTDARGKFEAVDGGEQTNVPHIYAVGDVLAGRLELTPVAIKAGEKLARRLFGGATAKMDYEMVPTTVFTPVEYGCVGIDEETAVKRYGAEALTTYLWQWTTLEHQAAHRLKHASVRVDDQDTMPQTCMAKLVCLNAEDEKVLGFHFVGPNAGEVTQGFALAIRLGAKKRDFDETIGIHPTDAEAMMTLEVKRADVKEAADWTASGGCGGGKCG